MEDAPFFLDVVGEVVRHQPVVHAEHDDVRPLHALHPVHGRERDLVGRRVDPRSFERVAQPRLEAGGIRSERGDRDQRVEIVAVTGFRPAAAAVERVERAAEPDLVADEAQQHLGVGAGAVLGTRACRGRRGTRRVGRWCRSARLRSPLRRQCRRPAIRCRTSRRSDRLGRRAAVARSGPDMASPRRALREPEIRERGAGAGAVEHLDADRRVGGDAGLARTAAAARATAPARASAPRSRSGVHRASSHSWTRADRGAGQLLGGRRSVETRRRRLRAWPRGSSSAPAPGCR